jgi:hypothetical protein
MAFDPVAGSFKNLLGTYNIVVKNSGVRCQNSDTGSIIYYFCDSGKDT